MVIKRIKPTLHTFEGFQFIPGNNIVPDELGQKIISLDRFKEQVDLGYMEIIEGPSEDGESPEDLAELLANKNSRDAKKIVEDSFDINELRSALESEERKTVKAAIQSQIDLLEEGRDEEEEED